MKHLKFAAIVAVAAVTSASAVEPAPKGPEWMGMNRVEEPSYFIPDYQEVGLKAVRWGDNSRDFSTNDSRIDAMVDAGLEIHWSINYRGGGSGSDKIDPDGTGRDDLADLDINGSIAQAWFDNYYDRCLEYMQRYSSPGNVKIKHYICGNEPDRTDPYTSIKGRPDICVELVKRLYQAAQEVNPNEIIVESAPVGSIENSYLRTMIRDYNLADYCDVIGAHVYGAQIHDERVSDPWECLGGEGLRKPIGISECNIATSFAPDGVEPRQWVADYHCSQYVQLKKFAYSYSLQYTYKGGVWGLMLDDNGNRYPYTWDEIDDHLTVPKGFRNGGFEEYNDYKRTWTLRRNVDDPDWPTDRADFQNTAEKHSGSSSLRVNCGARNGVIEILQVVDGLTPGSTVTVEGWAKTSGSNGRIRIHGYDPKDGDAYKQSNTVTSSSWQKMSVSATTQTTWIVISLYVDSDGNSSHWVNFDDITVTGDNSIGKFSDSSDIGSPDKIGDAVHYNGTYTVRGGGNDIWNGSDNFHYVYKELNGDGTIVAKVNSMDTTNSWAKAGVMIRESNAADSKFVYTVLTPGKGVSMGKRDGGTSSQTKSGLSAPYWVKLERSGDTFKGYYSSDGQSWTKFSSDWTVGMNSSVLAGLCVTAHDNNKLCQAEFNNVDITATEISSIYFEAEDYDSISSPSFSPFEVKTETAASGGQYIVVPDGNNWSPSDSESGQAHYQFELTDPSDLGLWARVNFPTGNDDSFYYRLDNNSWKTQNSWNTGGSWQWRKLTDFTNLSASIHTLKVEYREDGSEIDCFFLSTDGSTPN